MPIADRRAYATIPASDLDRAKAWYRDRLGLEPAEEHPTGMTYRLTGGTAFRLYPTSFAGTAQNTAMYFATDDLTGDMGMLRERGVRFEDYDLPGLQTKGGVATLGRYHVAWFKDSEGNILAIGDEPS